MEYTSIVLNEQEAIAGHTPTGMVPMSVHVHPYDQDDDWGHLGLFLPSNLLYPTTPEAQQLVCDYVARAAIDLGDAEDRSGNQAHKLLSDMANDPQGVGRVSMRNRNNWKYHSRFEWPSHNDSLTIMAQRAGVDERARQLEHAARAGNKRTTDPGKRKL